MTQKKTKIYKHELFNAFKMKSRYSITCLRCPFFSINIFKWALESFWNYWNDLNVKIEPKIISSLNAMQCRKNLGFT